MSVCLICLIGLPASGKSTLVKRVVEYFSNEKYFDDQRVEVIPVVYDDEINWNEVGDERNWKDKRKCVFNKVEAIISLISQERYSCKISVNKATLLILDDNMYYRSMRYDFYKMARRYGSSYCQIYLCSTKEVALKRNAERLSSVPNEVIARMSSNLEVPNKNKYPWEANTLTIEDSDGCTNENLVSFIFEALKNPLKLQKSVETQCHSRSSTHIADLALRQIIKTEIQKCLISRPSGISELASELAERKIKILADIRTGIIELPGQNPELSETLNEYITWLSPIILKY